MSDDVKLYHACGAEFICPASDVAQKLKLGWTKTKPVAKKTKQASPAKQG